MHNQIVVILLTLVVSLNSTNPILNPNQYLTIKHLSLTNYTNTIQINFPQAYSNPTFTFTIQEGQVTKSEFTILKTQQNITNNSLTASLQLQSSYTNLTMIVQICVMVSDNTHLLFYTIQIVNYTINSNYLINITNSYPYKRINSLNSSKVMVVAHSIPFRFVVNLVDRDVISLRIQDFGNNGYFSLGVIIIEKQLLMKIVFVIFEQINKSNKNYLMQTDNWLSDVSSESMAGVIVKYPTNNNKRFKVKLTFKNNFVNNKKNYLSAGFLDNMPDEQPQVSFAIILFNLTYQCSTSNYLSYSSKLYSTAPINECQQCHYTCQQCITTDDHRTTNQSYCVSCSGLRYLVPINSESGKCSCLPGLQVSSGGQCLQCQTNCLSFKVETIIIEYQPIFLLRFSYRYLTMDIEFKKNLVISVDGKVTTYNSTDSKNGQYLLTLNKQSLGDCEGKCIINFYFESPQLIKTIPNNKSLTTRQENVELRELYILEKVMSKQARSAFVVVGLVITLSYSTGQSSLLKLIFELEQTIEFHKYLKMDLPIVFKEFIVALGAFKFLDLTAVMPFELSDSLKELSSDALDTVGPAKAIIFQSGSNFYKNIVAVVVSLVGIWMINILIFVLMRVLPFSMLNNLAKKIEVRRYIILHDSLEGVVLPVVVFGSFQILNMVSQQLEFQVIYSLAFVMNLCMLFLPLGVVAFVYNRKGVAETIEVYEDLLQDCKIQHKTAYVFYLVSYYRKVAFGCFLNQLLPGLIQIYLIILINIVYLWFLLHIACRNLFTSKLKTFTRIASTLCLIAIEVLILFYDMQSIPLYDKLNIGLACIFLALTCTFFGLFEMLFKLIDTLCQKIISITHQRNKKQVLPDPDFISNIVKCHIGEQLVHQHIRNIHDKFKIPFHAEKPNPNDLLVHYESDDQDPSSKGNSQLVSIDESQNKNQQLHQDQDLSYFSNSKRRMRRNSPLRRNPGILHIKDNTKQIQEEQISDIDQIQLQ